MEKKDLANLFGVSLKTLYNWEKDKPELVRLINQGLALDDQIEEVERHLEKLKEIKLKANTKKLRLK